MCFIVVSKGVAMVTMSKTMTLCPMDISTVINTLIASQSLQQQESWTPICLPSFNDQAFTYGYVNYIEPEIGIVCISTSGEQEQFYNISRHLEDSKRFMTESKCLDDLRSSLLATPLEFPSGGDLSCEILHLMFYSKKLGQFFSSAFKTSSCGNMTKYILSSYRTVVEFLYNSGYRKTALFSYEYLNVYVEYNNDYNMYLATVPWTEITTDFINKIVSYVNKHFNFLFITKIQQISKRD
uniref:FUZ/MON1/HPS1 second Longin domain-containing protein n=1 Tax=Theileria lestoquardi TaxID=77054 RepID=Q2VA71_THELE|nr:unknown [Theileria lestoquardi]